MKPRSLVLLVAAIGSLLCVGALYAQEVGAQAGPGGLRAYWHVFIAYAVAWVLVLGWIVSIGRRLGRLEEKLALRDD